jgi:membrane protein implicated in regulation of membrane protease activity
MGFLDGISPWWWIALAILLGALEMVTVTTLALWSALAALLTAVALWLAPGLGWAGQIAIFGGLSIGLIFLSRWLFDRQGRGDDPLKLNRRADRLVGRDAVVVSFEGGEGKVEVDGIPWPARLEGALPTPAPGERVRILAADGIVVWVRPL